MARADAPAAQQIFFGAALFLSSAGGLVIEIVAGRLIAPYVGMSLYTWTAIIAVVLAGLSVGHWIGGRLAGVHVGAAEGARRSALALALAAVSALASLVLLRALSGPLLTSGLGPVPAIVVLTSALFFLPSLFVGVVAPILTKLAVDARPDAPGPVIGRMYALGTLGSIAGTLAAGYVMISWVGSAGTVFIVVAVYAGLAVAFGALSRRRSAGIGLILLVAAGGAFGIWGQTVKAFQSPCEVESDYFCIRVDDFTAESGRASALMALDHLVHSINDRDDPGILYSPYIHLVDELARRRFTDAAPFGAYFIGGGGYSLPRAWSRDFPRARLLVAEIDPAVTDVARRMLWLDTGAPGLDIRHRDARTLLSEQPREPSFDVVFGDAFHDISIPAHLVTREFHAEIAARLKPGGFYAVNVVDASHRPRFLFALLRTLKLDFPAVEVWAEADEFLAAQTGGNRRVTYIVVAGAEATGAGRVGATRGIRRSWIKWPADNLGKRLARAGPPVLTDDFAPVDRLMADLLLDDGSSP
ncbi:MAG: fused MFS/spermidine synthase [Magnetovibrio sp.]|nr:fused MFS/spermidine synthase [Magnetovibrio sp.]